MIKLKRNWLFCLTLLVVTTLPVASYAAGMKSPKLTLGSHATIRKPSDELLLKIAVVNIGDTAEETLAENSVKMQAVIENLEAAGLTKSDYETGQFTIHPTYTPYPQYPPHDWKQSINGYEVTHSISIHTDKLDMAGKIIDLANKAGANSISDIRFSLREPHLYWNEALTAAATNAVSDAAALAAATGVKLGRVLSITLDNAQLQSPHINAAYLSKAMAAEVAPPIEPGDVMITAHVTLIYEILPQ